MNLKRVYAIFLRQILLLKKGHFRLVSLFYWSTLDLIMWGFMSGYLGRLPGGQAGFIATLVGAVILSSFFFRVEQGIGVAFLEDVYMRNFINLFASPLSLHEYVLGLVSTSIFDTAVSISFMALLAWMLFAFNILKFGLLLVPFIAVLFMFGWTLGLLSVGVILRFGPSAEIFTWSIPALMTPFSAVFYPVSALPSFLQKVSALIPNSYVFEGMRASAINGFFDADKFLLALILACVYLALAYLFLYRSYKTVLRQGLLARFVTE
ncbi:MAG: ABC transporter permease [Candidatus Sungbacteria bacterium]|uniref:Transport permease protein n=1 Tax=Candidatus Sungiibacteriota bacterium TaxID=2750080 RepID=A0A932VR58_9BACT|nr:ABC transporter permease [Candidatus Sungbacteria bacterium]